ncbi:MAG: type II toxin-antitoxin system HicB family antitoxin [Taibaiella sp.]|nr:type II toxin-antitoxin system HicB family antitoxin [Taibaiella sp.]
MKSYDFTVVIEKDEDGSYLAICPALQGCYAEGSTQEEALEMIKDAIKLHIEDRLEKGEPLYEEVFSSRLKIAV